MIEADAGVSWALVSFGCSIHPLLHKLLSGRGDEGLHPAVGSCMNSYQELKDGAGWVWSQKILSFSPLSCLPRLSAKGLTPGPAAVICVTHNLPWSR